MRIAGRPPPKPAAPPGEDPAPGRPIPIRPKGSGASSARARPGRLRARAGGIAVGGPVATMGTEAS